MQSPLREVRARVDVASAKRGTRFRFLDLEEETSSEDQFNPRQEQVQIQAHRVVQVGQSVRQTVLFSPLLKCHWLRELESLPPPVATEMVTALHHLLEEEPLEEEEIVKISTQEPGRTHVPASKELVELQSPSLPTFSVS